MEEMCFSNKIIKT